VLPNSLSSSLLMLSSHWSSLTLKHCFIVLNSLSLFSFSKFYFWFLHGFCFKFSFVYWKHFLPLPKIYWSSIYSLFIILCLGVFPYLPDPDQILELTQYDSSRLSGK
jgi:hypothetical protein